MAIPEPLSFRDKVEYLGTLEIFSRLERGDLVKIAAISKQFGFERGRVLIHQGDVADKLYIVHSGRLEAVTINDEGVSRRVRLYLPSQIFKDHWLFDAGVHKSSYKARQAGIMIVIKSEDFLKLVANKKNRHIVDDLILSEKGIREYQKSALARQARRYKSIRLVPGEQVEFETKRSRWVLFGKLLFPTIGLLTIPAFTYLYLPLFFVNLPANWVLGLTILFLLLFGFYAWFEWYDWANDYLIITNKRLVHYEFRLRSFSGRGQDTLLSQVQSVEIERPNLISTILRIGTARVTTAALSVLFFNYLPSPERVQDTIDRIRLRQRSMSAGKTKANMRRSVEEYFKIPEMLRPLDEEPPPKPVLNRWQRLQKWWGELPIYRYRTETKEVITYRKHVFALFIETVWPLGIFVVLGIVLLVMRFLALDEFAGIVFILMILNGLWFIWLFEDWRNDTFQLTDMYVIDIDRKPFGFGESRKQARLDNIQNVEADRPNIVATLFNYGFVEIETAGADSKLVFENVANPEAIKNDVFKKQNKFRELQRKKQEAREREVHAIALDVYVQERELNRIGRRTPDFDDPQEDLVENILNSQKQSE